MLDITNSKFREHRSFSNAACGESFGTVSLPSRLVILDIIVFLRDVMILPALVIGYCNGLLPAIIKFHGVIFAVLANL